MMDSDKTGNSKHLLAEGTGLGIAVYIAVSIVVLWTYFAVVMGPEVAVH